jgi:hypothetical protein
VRPQFLVRHKSWRAIHNNCSRQEHFLAP